MAPALRVCCGVLVCVRATLSGYCVCGCRCGECARLGGNTHPPTHTTPRPRLGHVTHKGRSPPQAPASPQTPTPTSRVTPTPTPLASPRLVPVVASSHQGCRSAVSSAATRPTPVAGRPALLQTWPRTAFQTVPACSGRVVPGSVAAAPGWGGWGRQEGWGRQQLAADGCWRSAAGRSQQEDPQIAAGPRSIRLTARRSRPGHHRLPAAACRAAYIVADAQPPRVSNARPAVRQHTPDGASEGPCCGLLSAHPVRCSVKDWAKGVGGRSSGP